MSGETGLFDALRALAGTALSMVQSRIELAAIELSLARQRLFMSAILGVFAVLMLVVGVVAVSVCVVLLLWDRAGPLGLAAMGVIYLLVGLVLLVVLRRHLLAQPLLLETTNSELQRDAVLLRGKPSGP